jgi:hypothetical protein
MGTGGEELPYVAALLAPLRFASRNGFERLERVRDLTTTLTGGLGRLAAAAAKGPRSEAAQALLKLVPDDALSRADKIERLAALLATLERWPQSAEAPDRSAPPPAAAPRQAPLGPPPAAAPMPAARRAPAAAAQASGVPPAPSGGSAPGPPSSWPSGICTPWPICCTFCPAATRVSAATRRSES